MAVVLMLPYLSTWLPDRKPTSTQPPCRNAPIMSNSVPIMAAPGFRQGSPTDSAGLLGCASKTPDSCIKRAFGAWVYLAMLADMVGKPVPTSTTSPSLISLAPQQATGSGFGGSL